MSDSNVPDHLDTNHERNREQRIEAIKRWVDYIKSEPPEKWGPQQNAVVNDQFDAAREASISPSHRRRVRDAAARIIEAREDPGDDPD
jgi:hypothetical protein